jgi:1,5-anhydro-D-fructose reductase (1,5-anhydro-D-mannitol-forming)
VKLRWGVIGAGGIAINRTIPGILLSPQSSLVAINRTNRDELAKLQEKFGVIQGYLDAEQLVRNPDIDAVYIASPVKFHLEHALAAARAGKHILLEKPLGLHAREVMAIRQACEDNHVFFEGALMMRQHELHKQMRNLVAAGHIGQLVSMRLEFCFWYPPQASAWRLEKGIGGGGVFMDLGPHLIDLVQYVSGTTVQRANAMMDTISFPYEVEDSASVVMKLNGGGHALLSTHFNIPYDVSTKRFEVLGTEGILIAEETLGQEEQGTLKIKRTGESSFQVIPHTSGNLYTKQIDHFIALTQNPDMWSTCMDDQVQLQTVLDQVYDSAL